MKGNTYNSVYILVLVILACLSFAAMFYQYNVLQDFEYVLPEEELIEEEMLAEEQLEEEVFEEDVPEEDSSEEL